ncbi:DUF1801 domain-containing protein [bacterium]|nr:DUF1801 domain-containing protein [bacterium]
MTEIPFKNHDVENVFNNYPLEIRERLLYLRSLIYLVASETPGVGELEEALRWGEPSYLTTQTKSGSVIRIHHYPSKPFDYAMYFHCGTHLVDTFKELYPDSFSYGGNRSIEFMLFDKLPEEKIKKCISLALTYNLKEDYL